MKSRDWSQIEQIMHKIRKAQKNSVFIPQIWVEECAPTNPSDDFNDDEED